MCVLPRSSTSRPLAIRVDAESESQQRGIRMALSNLALFGSAFFTPIIVGKVTYTIGWPWTFYMVAIFSGAILPFVIFFAPETTYSRASHLNTDVGAADIVDQHDSQAGHPHGDGIALNHAAAGQTASDQRQNSSSEGLTVQANGDGARLPMEDGFLKRALPFSGRKTDENFVKLLLRPLPLYLHPAVAWVGHRQLPPPPPPPDTGGSAVDAIT